MQIKTIPGLRFKVTATGLALVSGVTGTHAPSQRITLSPTPSLSVVARREEHHEHAHSEEQKVPRPVGVVAVVRQSTSTSEAYSPYVGGYIIVR